MGYYVLKAARQYEFRELGLTLGGLSYLLGGILTLIFVTWWPLLSGFFLAVIFRKIFSDPTIDHKK